MLKVKLSPNLGRDVLENAINDYDVAEETIGGSPSVVIRNPRYLRNCTELTTAELPQSGYGGGAMSHVRELDMDSPLYGGSWRQATLSIWLEALNPFMKPANAAAGKGVGPLGLLSTHDIGSKKVYVSDSKLRMWSMRQMSLAYSGRFTGNKTSGYNGSSEHGRITFLTNGAGVALLKALPRSEQAKFDAAWSIKGHSKGSYNALTASQGTKADFPMNIRIQSILGWYGESYGDDDGSLYPKCVPFLMTPKETNKYNPMGASLFARTSSNNHLDCDRSNKDFNNQWAEGTGDGKETIAFYDTSVKFYGQNGTCGGDDYALAGFKSFDRKNSSSVAGPVYVMSKVRSASDYLDTQDVNRLLVHSQTRRYAEHMLAPIITQMAVARLRRFTGPTFMGETESTDFSKYTGMVCLWATSAMGSTDRPEIFCEESVPDTDPTTEYGINVSACSRTVYTQVSGAMWAFRAFQLQSRPAYHFTQMVDAVALSAGIEGRGGAVLGGEASLASLDENTFIPMGAKDLVAWGVAGTMPYQLGRLCINQNGAPVFCPDLEDKFRGYVFPAATLSILGAATQGSSTPCVRAVGTIGFDSAERDMDEWFNRGVTSYGQLNFKVLARGGMYNG